VSFRPYKTEGYAPKSVNRDKQDAIELGLAVCERLARPGVPMPQEMIADACGMTKQGVARIETRALKKLRTLCRAVVRENFK